MNNVFCFDDFELDSGAFTLRHGGEAVHIDAVVLRVLQVLVRHAGQGISKEQLIAEAWNDRGISDNALTVSVTRLRRLLHEYGKPRDSIVTVYGHGYRFTRHVSSYVREAEPAPSLALPSEFVGRKQVMLQFRAGLAAAQSGSGRLVALRGEAGIGKTRAAELIAEYAARSGCAVAWGSCRELPETPPLWPFVELIREVVSTQANAETCGLGLELEALLLKFVVSDRGPSSSETLHESGSKHRVFDAVLRLLAATARATTQVWILDDLHSADETSIELLRYLLPSLSRMRVLLVVTLRAASADGVAELPLLAALVHSNCTHVTLTPLDQADVTRHIVARFGAVDRAFCSRVYELSDGNPFCMVELLQHLQDGSTVTAAELTAPRFAREIVRQRLTLLDDDARDVLTYAAAIGRVFGLPLLAAVTGRTASALMATLDCASVSKLVQAVANAGTEFTFTHSVLRDHLYDRQSPSARRMRHLRILQTLEQRRALAEVSCAQLADHARSALPTGDLRKAVEYCTQAASAAEQTYAYDDAIGYLKAAREALDLSDDVDPRERFRLLFRHAVLVRARSSSEFLPLVDQLLRAARELGGTALAKASLLLEPLPGLPRLPRMSRLLTDALSALPLDEPSFRPALMARLATSVPLAYSASGCYAEIERALALSEHSPERVDRVGTRFGELFLYGGPEHRARAANTLIALQRLQLGPVPLSLLDMHRTLTALQHGDVATAARALDRWELRCSGLGEMLWHTKRLRALIQINLGNVADGQRSLLQLHRRTHCCDGSGSAGPLCLYDRYLPLPSSNPFVTAHATLTPDACDPPSIWALKVRTLEMGGALDEARSALELLPAERLSELPCDREFLGTMGALARTAIRLEAHSYVRVIYERLLPFPECFAVGFSGFCEGSVSLLLGLLARSLGDLQRARVHFESAHAYSDRAGFSRSATEARIERERCELESLARRRIVHSHAATKA